VTLFDEIAQIMLEGLKLWNSKESTKYEDRIISLRQHARDELAKPALDEIPIEKRASYAPDDLRSDAVLASLRAQLRDVWDAATAAAGAARTAALPG